MFKKLLRIEKHFVSAATAVLQLLPNCNRKRERFESAAADFQTDMEKCATVVSSRQQSISKLDRSFQTAAGSTCGVNIYVK